MAFVHRLRRAVCPGVCHFRRRLQELEQRRLGDRIDAAVPVPALHDIGVVALECAALDRVSQVITREPELLHLGVAGRIIEGEELLLGRGPGHCSTALLQRLAQRLDQLVLLG